MYLVRRYLTYWAMHDLPAALHKTYGKRLARSLETHDLPTAKRVAALVWAHEWSRLVGDRSTKGADAAEARYYANLIKNATGDEYDNLIDYVAEVAERRHDAAKDEDGRKAALQWNRAAQGKLTATDEHVEPWIAGLRDKPATIKQKRRIAGLFATAFPWLKEVQARQVQAWFAELARKEDMAAPTFDRHLSCVRGYWRYLHDHGVVEANPLRDIQRPKSVRKVAPWKPFTPAQVVALREAAKAAGDAELVHVIELGMWSGARIDEISSLKVEHVDLKRRSFKITAAKTGAGVREVPIHSKLMPLMKKLVVGRGRSEYVLVRPRAGTKTRRSKAVGERFGLLKTKMGHDDRLVFHSIRKTVGTALENAGVPEGVSSDLLGHEKPNITYGIYSGGASLEVKREALEKVKYPKPL